jgi:hypothetical protein
MIARGFKPVGWVAAVGTAALGCYMLSLRVAAERAELTNLEESIVSTRQQIRSLQTELGTRGRVQQLQQWNDEVLALAAPVSGQFVGANVTLARFDTRQPVLADQAVVQMASAEAGPAPSPAPAQMAQPAPRRAVADSRSVAPPPPFERAMVRRASVDMTPTPARAQAGPAPMRTAAADARSEPARPRSAAPAPTAARPRSEAPRIRTAAAEPRQRPSATNGQRRPGALLDDRTMRDLGTAARAERSGGTRN